MPGLIRFGGVLIGLTVWMPCLAQDSSQSTVPFKTLDSHFPFTVPASVEAWDRRSEALKTRVAVATGLFPMLPRGPVDAIRHSPIERDGFRFEKVYFQSFPGHYVTGLLFSPSSTSDRSKGKLPAVLSPHGHGGRMMRYTDKKIAEMIASGDERYVDSGCRPKLARCAQLARMGCLVFIFDMVGYDDSVQLSYEFAHRRHAIRDGEAVPGDREPWRFFSTPADARLQSILGLQAYNALRAFDFLASLPNVDSQRLAVTGGSGGGTQTILMGALEPRVAVSFPNGMVSTSMQGGCACENACLLRVGTGNVELAALMAPRPMAMTAADDWTRDMMTDGYPQLRELYNMLGAPGNVQCTSLLQFGHNYNYVTRRAMYEWMNQHLHLQADELLEETDFKEITDEEGQVWSGGHEAPTNRGPIHEQEILSWWSQQNEQALATALGENAKQDTFDQFVGPAIRSIFDCEIPMANQVQWESVGEAKSVGEWTWQAGYVIDQSTNRRIKAQRFQSPVQGKVAENDRDSEESQDPSRAAATVFVASTSTISFDQPMPLPAMLPDTLGKCDQVLVIGDAVGDGAISSADQQVGSLDFARSQKTNPQPRRTSAAFTFGYNRSLAVRRTGDILAAISLASGPVKGADAHPAKVALLASGPASVSALAAVSLAGPIVDQAHIEINRFRFGDLRYQTDECFVPGMVKYGDIDSLVALRAPYSVHLYGDSPSEFPTATAVFDQRGGQGQFQCVSDPLFP